MGRAGACAGAIAWLAAACSSEQDPCELEPPPIGIDSHGDVLVVRGDDQTLRAERETYALVPEEIARRVGAYLHRELDQIVVFTSAFRAAEKNGGPFYLPLDVACPAGLAGMAFMGQLEVGAPPLRTLRTLAEETGHQWLAHAKFVDPETGEVSDELLGRDRSHWSTLMDSQASFAGGMDWQRQDEDTYIGWATSPNGWSSLDLWLMGLAGAEEVGPFVLLRDAYIFGTDAQVGRETVLDDGRVVVAEAVELTHEDILKAQPRPPRRRRPIRQAFVLLTAPGEDPAVTAATAGRVEDFRANWTDWVQWQLSCRGPLCTALDGSCPSCEIVCGDGLCHVPELAETCPADCIAERRLTTTRGADPRDEASDHGKLRKLGKRTRGFFR